MTQGQNNKTRMSLHNNGVVTAGLTRRNLMALLTKVPTRGRPCLGWDFPGVLDVLSVNSGSSCHSDRGDAGVVTDEDRDSLSE